MFIVSRKVGERVVIGDAVIVQVLAVNPNHIRLGVEAPPHLPIAFRKLPVDNAAAGRLRTPPAGPSNQAGEPRGAW